MDKSDAQAIIERELEPLMRQLGIPHWQISVSSDLADEVTLGNCEALADYEKAHLRFNPSLFDDVDAVVKTLRHELFHLVLSPFELYREAIETLESVEPIRPLLKRIWTHAEEQAVINLERMYVRLTSELPVASPRLSAKKTRKRS